MTDFDLRRTVESLLGQEVVTLSLAKKGMCNDVYYAETTAGGRFSIKAERKDKSATEQNDLLIEANLLRRLNRQSHTFPVPQIAFVSESPILYGYRYVEGTVMFQAWLSLSDDERISLSTSLGRFHAILGKLITAADSLELGLRSGPDENLERNCKRFLASSRPPIEWKKLVERAWSAFEETLSEAHYQCIHNDAHPENIIVNGSKLASVVDFGDCEFNDISKDLCYYVRHYPNHYRYVLDAYSEVTGNRLSEKRVVLHALLTDLVYFFSNPNQEQRELERIQKYCGIPVNTRVENYQRLLAEIS